MSMGFRTIDRYRSPHHDGTVGKAQRNMAEARRRFETGLDLNRLKARYNLAIRLQEIIRAVPDEMILPKAYLHELLGRVRSANTLQQFRELANEARNVRTFQEMLLTLPVRDRSKYLPLVASLVIVVSFLAGCGEAQSAQPPPAITVEVNPTATQEPAVEQQPSPEVTVTATPVMPQDENGDYMFENIGSEEIPDDKKVDSQLQVNTFAEKIKGLGIPANIKLMVVWLGDRAIVVGELGGSSEDYMDEEGNVADYGPGDYVYESDLPPGYGFATSLGASDRLGFDIEKVTLNRSSGHIEAFGQNGKLQGSVSLGEDNPQWKPIDQAPDTVEPATATTAPATEAPTVESPTATSVAPTATSQPVPTEVPTAVPTEAATEVESPEHVQAMKNVSDWMSGNMQVPDDKRFRTYLGELQPYGRLGGDQETGQSSDIAMGESYFGVVLGSEQLPNGDVIAFFGFEDSLGNRFVAPMRVGNDTTAGDIIALVDSYANSSAGDNRDTHVFAPPTKVGLKLQELIGSQVMIGTITSVSAQPDQLPNVNPIYIEEIKEQCSVASAFDSVLRRLATGASFSSLSTDEISLFGTTNSKITPELMLTQINF